MDMVHGHTNSYTSIGLETWVLEGSIVLLIESLINDDMNNCQKHAKVTLKNLR